MNLACFDVAPHNTVGTTPFLDAVHLQADESLWVRLVLFLVDEIGYLLTIDPGLDTGSFGKNAVFVPFAVLEMFVRFELVLGGHPTTTGFTVDISGFGSVSFGRLDLNLRSVDPTELVASFLFLIIQLLGLRTNLHARIEFVVDQFDFEVKFEITIQLVGAKEGVGAAFLGRAEDGSVFDDISCSTVFLTPSLEGLTIKDGLEATGFMMLGAKA